MGLILIFWERLQALYPQVFLRNFMYCNTNGFFGMASVTKDLITLYILAQGINLLTGTDTPKQFTWDLNDLKVLADYTAPRIYKNIWYVFESHY